MFLKTRKIGIASTLINLKMAKILKIHQPKKHILSFPSQIWLFICVGGLSVLIIVAITVYKMCRKIPEEEVGRILF